MNAATNLTRTPELHLERIRLFSDAVFAVAITLLFLELGQIRIADVDSLAALAGELRKLLPSIVAVFASAVTVGTFWIAHFNVFHVIERSDRAFLWINTLLLMCVAFMPYLTSQMVEHPRAAVPIYGLGLVLCSAALLWLWVHATSGNRLVDAELSPVLVRNVRRRMLIGPAVYIVAIAISWLNIATALLLFALMQVFYMLPGDLDRYLKGNESPVPAEADAPADPPAEAAT